MRTLGSMSLPALVCSVAFAVFSAAGCVYVAPLNLGPGKLREEVVIPSARLIELNKVAMCEVDGFIGDGTFLWRTTTIGEVKEKLERAAADRRVKAVILRISSPGGEVTASDVLYHELRAFREATGKPIVACIMGLGTSGAYYVALAADTIICHPTAVTGSIGVIMQGANVEGLYQKLGLKPVTIKSGDKKDIGSATRPMTEEERALLQEINQQLFERFMTTVRERRVTMNADDLTLLGDGRVVTATQALSLKMVDRVGYLDDAVAEAKHLANIRDAHVIIYTRSPWRGGSAYVTSSAEASDLTRTFEQALRTLTPSLGPGFYYLWAPEW